MLKAGRARLAPTFFLLGALIASPALFATGPAIWSDASEAQIVAQGERTIVPLKYRTVALDQAALAAVLRTAPLEGSANAQVTDVILALPLPDGDYGRFRIEESPIMAPELAAKYPEIQTYRGQGIDDPAATVRFDQTPAGFHAAIHSTQGRIYIDPFSRGDVTQYVSYFTRDYSNPENAQARRCHVNGEPIVGEAPSHESRSGTSQGVPNLPNGELLKTYRTVVAATGEYTIFHSADQNNPTVAEGMAAIVTAMNRVNGVYERDLAIFMELVANNDQVVYIDPETDPYTNDDSFTMLGQNQANLDAVIGSPNYDIGHVFATDGGGDAVLHATCDPAIKAQGVSGLPSPTGDVFWIDFVSHELGHQWGGNHTFNGDTGSCTGDQHNPDTAYEPGSGTTIQAYAGTCGSQNIQNNSDDYFHNASYQEIVNFITTGAGNNCDVATVTGNTPPTPDAGDSFTIPISTPFELCGSATDPDGDTLTYNWEQWNLGPAGDPNSPVGDAPIFRSFPSKLSPCRTFPQLSDLQDNTQTLGEILPDVARTLSFRMLVRDNRSGGGGADYDEVDVVVSDLGGPFTVTVPNTAVTWIAGTTETVEWDVAATNLPPFNCTQVDISVSEDGGETYATELAGTPNDGSQDITVPVAATTEARLQVRCSDNIFFDTSDTNFTIEIDESAPEVTIFAPLDGANFFEDTPIVLAGAAYDDTGHDISSTIKWSTGLTPLGSGSCDLASPLGAGNYTTKAIAMAKSLPGLATTNFTVTEDGPGSDCKLDTQAFLITKPNPIGILVIVHTTQCEQRPVDKKVVSYLRSNNFSFASTCGCVEAVGVPKCTLKGSQYVIIYQQNNAHLSDTSINRACIDPPDADPSNDCTCKEIFGEKINDCVPIPLRIYADGFESGDTSSWSSTVP